MSDIDAYTAGLVTWGRFLSKTKADPSPLCDDASIKPLNVTAPGVCRVDSAEHAFLVGSVADRGEHWDTVNVTPLDSNTKYVIPKVTPQNTLLVPSFSKCNREPTRNQQSLSDPQVNTPLLSQLVTLAVFTRLHLLDPSVQSPLLSAPTTTISVAILTDDPGKVLCNALFLNDTNSPNREYMFCLVLLLEIDGEINSWKKVLSDFASIVY